MSQRLPSDVKPKVTSFVVNTRTLRMKNGYSLPLIGNMDETPPWLAIPGETIVILIGDR